jgi:hypothetical protein
MKKLYISLLSFLLINVAIFAQNISSFDSLQLDEDSYWNGITSSYGSHVTELTDSIFTFKNRFSRSDFGYGLYESWSGFSYSSSGNDSTAGYTNDYSAITAGGAFGSSNYGIFFTESSKDTIKLSQTAKLDSVFITNSTYAYLSMKDGDMFAKKFGGDDGTEEDWFLLTIRGLKNGVATDTIEFYLADFRSVNNDEDYIINEWTKVDLSVLDSVDMLELSLSSSDVGDWGMNTPSYFCIDNLSGADFEDFTYISGEYWKGKTALFGSYPSTFTDGLATFPNTYSVSDYGYGISEAWNGFIYSSMKDDTTAGFMNQYSAYPAMGADSSSVYAVCYNRSGSDTVSLSSATALTGAYFTNATYPYLSMKNGDAFAKKFGGADGTDEDWFKLNIIGLNNGTITDTVEFYLADFRSADNAEDYLVDEWEWVDFSELGAVDKIVFSLSSSDVGQWGMNTPAYFCMDNLNGQIPTSINTPTIITDNFRVYPNPFASRITINGTDEIRNVRIYNISGKIVEQVQVSNGRTEIELSLDDLKAGIYFIQIENARNTIIKKVIKQ